MTDLRRSGPLHAAEGNTPKAASERQPMRRMSATGMPTAARAAQGGRPRYASLQWMLAVGSIAAVVVGANGLALQDGRSSTAIAENIAYPQAVAAVQPAGPTKAQAQQEAASGAPASAERQIFTMPGLPELSVLALPPIPRSPVPQLVQPQIRQALPMRPAARSSSSR